MYLIRKKEKHFRQLDGKTFEFPRRGPGPEGESRLVNPSQGIGLAGENK